MKVDEIVEDIESSEVFDTHKFTIAATTHAFRVLCDSLYSNKIKAVIRELSSNAYDAHVYVNKENLPFIIHLPSKFEPNFSVRDFGNGMSDEEILELYTSYFSSGDYKRCSNEFIGSYGLGSKSPFAVTNSFNVTSFQNGVKRLYTCFINDKGIPTVTRLGEFPYEGDDQDGLLVEFAVKEDDIDTYADETADLFTHFTVKPTIIGFKNFYFNVVDYEIVGKTNWAVRDHHNGICAIIGGISYPIDKHNIIDLSDDHLELFNSPLDLTFSIGELSITPSREQLSYDNKTIQCIKNRLDAIISEVQLLVEEKIASAHSLWRAQCLYNDIFHNNVTHFNKLVCSIKIAGVKWHDQPLISLNVKPCDLEPTKIISIYSCSGRYSYRTHSHTQRIKTELCPYEITSKSTTCLLINDLETGANKAARRLVENGEYKKVYIITFQDKQGETTFREKVGVIEDDLVRLSSIPRQPRKPRESGFSYAKKSKVLLLQKSNSNAAYTYWKETSIGELDNTPTCYVELYRYEAVVNHTNISPAKLIQVWNILNKCGIGVNIIGIRKNIISQIRNKFINIYDYVLELVKRRFEQEDFGQNIADNNEYDDHCNAVKFIKHVNILSGLTSEESILFDNFVQSAKNGTEFIKWQKLADFASYTLVTKSAQLDCKQLRDSLLCRYPLLKYVDVSDIQYKDSGYVLREELTHYIALVNSYEKDLQNV